MARRILIVGSDHDATRSWSACLDALGCIVDIETDDKEVMDRIGVESYSGIILDTMDPAIPEVRMVSLLRQNSTLPVIILSDDTSDNDVMRAGVQAVLVKPFPLREFKRVVQRVIPPTREELTRDHSGGEATIYRNALALAKAGNFVASRKAIELLDNPGAAAIHLLAYHVRVGDLMGAKDTALSLPSLKVGGHWVRCLITSFVKAGDIDGAVAIVENLVDAEERSFHRGIIVAQQAATGDLSGAQAMLLSLSPGENGYERAVGAIAYAFVESGKFPEAISLVRQLSECVRLNAIGEILSAQVERDGITGAMQTAANINDEDLRQRALSVIDGIRQKSYRQTYTLLFWRRQGINCTFSELYPVD